MENALCCHSAGQDALLTHERCSLLLFLALFAVGSAGGACLCWCYLGVAAGVCLDRSGAP